MFNKGSSALMHFKLNNLSGDCETLFFFFSLSVVFLSPLFLEITVQYYLFSWIFRGQKEAVKGDLFRRVAS